jgi:hypothetical protein
LFIDEKQSPFDIAKQLNIEGIPAQFGRGWTRISGLIRVQCGFSGIC